MNPLLPTPPTVATIGPVVAPTGTVAVICVSLQPCTEVGIPLKVTLPMLPKPVPEIVTEVP